MFIENTSMQKSQDPVLVLLLQHIDRLIDHVKVVRHIIQALDNQPSEQQRRKLASDFFASLNSVMNSNVQMGEDLNSRKNNPKT